MYIDDAAIKTKNQTENQDSTNEVIKINILPQASVVTETIITPPTLIQNPVVDVIPAVQVNPEVDTIVIVEKEKGKF